MDIPDGWAKILRVFFFLDDLSIDNNTTIFVQNKRDTTTKFNEKNCLVEIIIHPNDYVVSNDVSLACSNLSVSPISLVFSSAANVMSVYKVPSVLRVPLCRL